MHCYTASVWTHGAQSWESQALPGYHCSPTSTRINRAISLGYLTNNTGVKTFQDFCGRKINNGVIIRLYYTTLWCMNENFNHNKSAPPVFGLFIKKLLLFKNLILWPSGELILDWIIQFPLLMLCEVELLKHIIGMTRVSQVARQVVLNPEVVHSKLWFFYLIICAIYTCPYNEESIMDKTSTSESHK